MASSTDITFCKHQVVYGSKVISNVNVQNTARITLCTITDVRNWFGSQDVGIDEILVTCNNTDANVYNIRPTYTPIIWRNGNITINLGFGTGINISGGTTTSYRFNFSIFWFPIRSQYVIGTEL